MRPDRFTHYVSTVTGSKSGTKRGLVKLGFRIEETLLESLKAAASANRRSVSGHIRALIEDGCLPREKCDA